MAELFHVSEVIKVLIDQEKIGYTFYQQAAAGIDDPKASKLFEKLAKDEIKHEATFKKLLEKSEKKPGIALDPFAAEYIATLIKSFPGVEEEQARKAKSAHSKEDALKVAEIMEREAIFFLHEIITLDPALDEEKVLLGALKEERSHLAGIMQAQMDVFTGSLML